MAALLLPLVQMLVLLWLVRFSFGWLNPLPASARGALFKPLVGVLQLPLKLCRLVVRGVWRLHRGSWRNSVRQRGVAMTVLLWLIISAVW